PGSARGRVVAGVADRLGMGIDLSSPSVAQLSETSALTVGLSHPVPAGIQVRSIGASGDLVVPAGRTRLAGAVNTTVHLGGTHAHDELPGAPATTREIGLALAGRAPTCADPSTALADLITSERIARTESALGLVLAAHLPP
ncbi:MAG: hypothetical protein ACXWCB_12155, partial [Acidimicrobiales bacterium]